MRMQSLNRKSLVRRCGGDTVSSPCSVWFPPMWATQRALKFKVLQSGSEWEWETQRRLCVLVIGSTRKGFSWKTAREPVGRVKGSWGSFFSMVGEFFFFDGWDEMCIDGFRKKIVCSGSPGSPHLWLQRHGPVLGSALRTPQRGDFFIYSISCHIDPEMAPFPSPKLPCPPLWPASPIPPHLKKKAP